MECAEFYGVNVHLRKVCDQRFRPVLIVSSKMDRA